jgi:acyl-CoA dehydrogenase
MSTLEGTLTEDAQLLTSSIRSMLEPVPAADRAGVASPAWERLAAAEIPWIGIGESLGGPGGTLDDAAAAVQVLAELGVSAPAAETALACGWLLARAGLPAGRSVCTLALAVGGTDHVAVTRVDDGWVIDGEVHRVPWAHASDLLLVPARVDAGRLHVFAVRRGQYDVVAGVNMAGEPRDSVRLRGAEIGAAAWGTLPGVDIAAVRARAALARAVQIAGAARAASVLSREYASQRVQFGKPIAAFQAVAQHLVHIVEESAAAEAAVATGLRYPDSVLAAAAAKARASQAALRIAQSAHQVHGAIGISAEYPLGGITCRLWSWAGEWGDDADWNQVIGERLRLGPDTLWQALTEFWPLPE